MAQSRFAGVAIPDNPNHLAGMNLRVNLTQLWLLSTRITGSQIFNYNPFIFVGSGQARGREVHLVKYPPTDKADLSLLGTGKDVSRPEEDLYYVSIDLMPFALNMPVSEFPIPEEGIRIDESYPKFATWVKSNGAQAKDWYKYPKK